MEEILAPVGGKEQLIAAVRSGANAVYLGAKNFNARRNADNFNGAELRDIVSYCHARNVKVHITLNTLVMDSEMSDLIDEIKYISESGADAVIIQDLAVVKLVHELCPTLEMHASTQMTIHNLAGAEMAKALGFKRAVLSRELSLEEIRKIAEQTDIELEAFVHGALCMCMSGACYLSSMLGGRSGNRGLCAQPCRLDFRYGKKDHALSLKDMSSVTHIRELAAAGVCSFKIEGRMKRPEYVAAAVTACREALAGNEPDMDTLQAVFSRQGFTDGYFTGKRTADMFGFRSKDDVTAADKVLKDLSLLYKDEPKLVPIRMSLFISEYSKSVLTATDGVNIVSVDGEVCSRAEKIATDETLVKRYLSKTGGTPFFLEKLDFSAEGEPFITAGELNEMRRNALDSLLELRSKITAHAFNNIIQGKIEHHSVDFISYRLRFEKYEQAFDDERAEKIILPLSEIEKNSESLSLFGKKLICEIPVLIFPFDEEKIRNRLFELKNKGLTDVICENIGTIKIAKELGFTIHGGHGLNIINSISLCEYENLGLTDATISFELAGAKIRKLGGKIGRGILGYGFLPLMRMRACPLKKQTGCGECKGEGKIKDRMGKEFDYLCFERKFGTLYNSLPLWLDKDISGIDFITLYFTTEKPKRCREIFEKIVLNEPSDIEKTNGLYFRELL